MTNLLQRTIANGGIELRRCAAQPAFRNLPSSFDSIRCNFRAFCGNGARCRSLNELAWRWTFWSMFFAASAFASSLSMASRTKREGRF